MSSITDKLRHRFRQDKSPSPSPRTVEEKGDDKKSNCSDDGTDSRDDDEMDEKKVYEMQLSQLQEQLVAAMIENQALGAEIKSYREGTKVNEIQDELEKEKRKNKALQENLEFAQKSQVRGIYTREICDWVDVGHEATEESPALIHGDPNAPPPGLIDRINRWIVTVYHEVLADLTEDVESTEIQEEEGPQLTVKQLKDNMKRFRNGVKPIGSTVKGAQRVVTWKNPALTFITFVVYMYSVWYGWLLPVVLFMMILKLSVNYLRYRGLNINLVFLADEEDEDEEKDEFKDLGMSAKFDLVVQVARKVQNTFGEVADNLEKLKNLLMWEQPLVTRRLYLVLWVLLVLTSILPGTTLFTAIALVFGVRMFIIQFVYTKFPRMKHRYDSTQRMWKTLPTDADKEEFYHRAAIDRCVLPDHGDGKGGRNSRCGSKGKLQSEREAEFAELFQLPTSEVPLRGWEGGKRCTMIDKEKSLRSSFKNGKMYLTHSFLCFARPKSLTHGQMKIVIPLTDILEFGKAKPYSWLPGEGMSIEATVVGKDKPYTFGAMLNRDDVFDAIVKHGARLNLPWALEHVKESTPDSEDGKAEKSSEASKSAEQKTGEDQFIADVQSLAL